jgi:hypothetical protein
MRFTVTEATKRMPELYEFQVPATQNEIRCTCSLAVNSISFNVASCARVPTVVNGHQLSRMSSSGILGRVGLVGADVSEERISCIIRMKRINVLRLIVIANVAPSSPNLVTLMIEAIHSSETLFLQEQHGV